MTGQLHHANLKLNWLRTMPAPKITMCLLGPDVQGSSGHSERFVQGLASGQFPYTQPRDRDWWEGFYWPYGQNHQPRKCDCMNQKPLNSSGEIKKQCCWWSLHVCVCPYAGCARMNMHMYTNRLSLKVPTLFRLLKLNYGSMICLAMNNVLSGSAI